MATPPDGRLRAGAAAVALACAALAGWAPATGQQRPESILPPGFGQPAARPTTPPRPAPTARPSATPRAGAVPRPGATPLPRATPPTTGAPVTAPATVPTPSSATAVVQPLPTAAASPTPTPSPAPTIDPATLAFYRLPPASRRSLSLVGPATEREGALPADAFGRADGRMLEGLMRRMTAPLPSRWLSITLRRVLAARLATPPGVNGADFVAERAWLLLRMGEADAARAVVQGVDDDNYTPKLFDVAMNAMLAAGDPAGLCPLADAGSRTTGERGWTLAQAMCTGLGGDPTVATALMTAARRQRVASGIDLTLAQKVMGAGPGGRQAVTVEWDGVDRLTIWRFGLALATGVAIPDPLLAAAAPQVAAWRATAPGVPLPDRVAPAEVAAGLGVLSSAALVDLYAAVAAMDDPPAPASGVADDLRAAYVGSADDRLAALRRLWGGEDRRPAYARLVLTARAAARIVPAGGSADTDRLVAAMLGAGLDHTAARWSPYVETGGDAWAMLALADPVGRRLTYRDLSSYAGNGGAAVKRQLFFAALAGLGRLEPGDVERAAQALDVRIGAENAWTRALDRAARNGEPGTVVLLAATGMQTPAWRGVPPAMLYRIVGALRAVGLGGPARMIAAEAIARS